MAPYTLHITLYDLIIFGMIFTGWVFCLFLWFVKSINRNANRFLALALLTMSLWMLRILHINLPAQMLLAVGPLLYFYVLKITQREHQFKRKDLLHLGPFMFVVVPAPVLQLLVFVSVISYLYLADRLIQKFYKALQPVLMDRSLLEFRWLRRLLGATTLLWVLWIVSESGLPVYGSVYIFFAVMIIWTAAAAFLRPQSGVIKPIPVIQKTVPSELKQKSIWLKKMMESGHYYLDSELTLNSLAKRLGLTTHELSRVINTALKKSFNDFINEYRVQEMVRKMQDTAYDHITLLGIAFESGFNSKSSFNRIFKQITGISPVEYKALLKKEALFYNLGCHPRFAVVISNHETTPLWSSEKLNRNYMLKSNLKIAWRVLVKNRAHSIINIAGLTVGMACSFFIMLWINSEKGYDHFHRDADQIYQVWRNFKTDGKIDTWTSLPEQVAGSLKADYPEVEEAVSARLAQKLVVTVGNQSFQENGGHAGPGFFRIFSFPFLLGNPATALQESNQVVITARTAAKLFGQDWQEHGHLLGRTITVDHRKEFIIAGVASDVPDNSSIKFDIVLPIEDFLKQDAAFRDWGWMDYAIYVKLQKGTNPQAFNTRVADLMSKRAGWTGTELFLQRFSDIYLHSTYKDGHLVGGRIQYVHIFSAAGLFLLLIACINFMNLTTARSARRAREIGVRKTLGAPRPSLIVQFMAESVGMALAAFILALALVCLLLPVFNGLTDKSIRISDVSASFLLSALGISLLVGIISGSYPAIYLSSFNPLTVLRGNLRHGLNAISIRKVLVVFQFAISVLLIVSTVVVYRQLNYVRTVNLGMDRANLLYISREGTLKTNAQMIRNELLKQPGIASVTTSSNNPLEQLSNTLGINWSGKAASSKQLFYVIGGDYDFVRTMQMQLVAGRDFSKAFGTDSTNYIINEQAARTIGGDVIGKTIKVYGVKGQVVGIVRNFSMNSLYSAIEPVVIRLDPANTNYLFVRIKPGRTKEAVARLVSVCKQFNPGYPFACTFVDQKFEQAYRSESVMGTLANIFAVIALFISCLGLLGLAAHSAEQRTKEIGVRKVLGASVASIVTLLSKEFVRLVIIAFFIAAPFGWYIAHRWLQNFTYRIALQWWMFALAGLTAMLIAVLTIGSQAIRSARANPVKSLRSE